MSVYVVQERKKLNSATGEFVPVINIIPAAKFGNLVELFTPTQHALLTAQVASKLKTAMRNFSDEDYILPIGNPVLIGVAVAAAARANMGKVKILHWERELREYIVLSYEL